MFFYFIIWFTKKFKIQNYINDEKHIYFRKWCYMPQETQQNFEEQLKKKDEQIQKLQKEIEEKEKKLSDLNRNLEKRVIERTVEVNRLLLHKTRFVDNLSHDLGTPLTPLITLLPVIKEELKNPETVKLMDTCIRNAEYIKRVVNNTRKLAELSSTDLMLNKEQFNQFVEDLKERYDVVFRTFKIEVVNNISDDIYVKTDKSRITELLDQITSNAVNSMQDGGDLKFDAKYITRDDNTFVQISITDTGIGLTRDQTDHLFDEFYKADESRHKLDSTGLGLAICRRIIEKHGGRIWAESHGKGTGTTIHFTLPSSNIVQTRSFI